MTEPNPDSALNGQVQSAAFLGALLTSVAHAVAAFDLDGRVLFWNPAAEKLFGWTAAEVVGQFAPHVPPAGRAGFVERVRRLHSGEPTIAHRSTRRRKDGSTVELSVTSSAVHGSNGEITGVVSLIADVTELVALEQARAEADRLFRAAFENAPNGVMLSDPAGAFLDVNPAACTILQRGRDVLLASTFAAITHPDDLGNNLDVLDRALAGEIDTYRFDKRYLAPDGATIWVDLSVSVVRDSRDAPQFMVAQIVDVGAEREAERAAAESTAQLEAVARVARQLLTADDARPLVCAAVAEVAHADFVTVTERREDGAFEITAATLAELVGTVLPADETWGAVRASLGGESVFIPDARNNETVNRRLTERFGTRSILYEPVRGESGVVGGLNIVWRRPVAEVEPRVLAVIRLLAAEAALGIERTNLLRRLEQQALTDELTRLPNRRAFENEIKREVARARRGGSLTVAIIDIDWFKRFNDTHGHVEGDRLLRAAAPPGAARSAAATRSPGSAARSSWPCSPTATRRRPGTSSTGSGSACPTARPARSALPTGTARRASTSCSGAPTPLSTGRSTPAATGSPAATESCRKLDHCPAQLRSSTRATARHDQFPGVAFAHASMRGRCPQGSSGVCDNPRREH